MLDETGPETIVRPPHVPSYTILSRRKSEFCIKKILTKIFWILSSQITRLCIDAANKKNAILKSQTFNPLESNSRTKTVHPFNDLSNPMQASLSPHGPNHNLYYHLWVNSTNNFEIWSEFQVYQTKAKHPFIQPVLYLWLLNPNIRLRLLHSRCTHLSNQSLGSRNSFHVDTSAFIFCATLAMVSFSFYCCKAHISPI